MIQTRMVHDIGLILFVSLSVTVGFAEGRGRPGSQEVALGDSRASRTVAPVTLESIEETLESEALEAPAPPGPDVSDVAVETPPAATPETLVELLDSIDVARRGTVTIDVELADSAGETAAAAVEARWQAGDFDQALDGLRALENDGRIAGIGIDWGEGGGSLKGWSEDKRIGGTRTEAQELRLDFHTSSGNLFSVIRWGSTTGTSAWTVNLSTDFGDTWTETYSFASGVGLIGVAAVVVDDYVYVAYVAGNALNEGRLRRASAITGAIDSGYGFVVVVNGGATHVEEVALAANPDDANNRIYYLSLMDNDSLRYLWDDATDGTTFTDASPPASAEPEFGLDATFIHEGPSCQDYLALSYAGTDGSIHVWQRDENAWSESVVQAGAGSSRRTTISAYGTTLFCAFEFPYGPGTGVRYAVSYNCGDNWSLGNLAVPDGVFYFGYFEPEVAARGGYGVAVAYQGSTADFDPAFYRFRYGYSPGQWTTPLRFNNYDVFTGSDVEIMLLPPLDFTGPPPWNWGIWSLASLYLSLDPEFRVPYYDSTVDFAFLYEPPMFADSFESGDVSHWQTRAP